MVSIDHFGYELRRQLHEAAAKSTSELLVDLPTILPIRQIRNGLVNTCCEAMAQEVQDGDVIVQDRSGCTAAVPPGSLRWRGHDPCLRHGQRRTCRCGWRPDAARTGRPSPQVRIHSATHSSIDASDDAYTRRLGRRSRRSTTGVEVHERRVPGEPCRYLPVPTAGPAASGNARKLSSAGRSG